MVWEAKVAVECLQAGSQGPVRRLSGARLGRSWEGASLWTGVCVVLAWFVIARREHPGSTVVRCIQLVAQLEHPGSTCTVGGLSRKLESSRFFRLFKASARGFERVQIEMFC